MEITRQMEIKLWPFGLGLFSLVSSFRKKKKKKNVRCTCLCGGVCLGLGLCLGVGPDVVRAYVGTWAIRAAKKKIPNTYSFWLIFMNTCEYQGCIHFEYSWAIHGLHRFFPMNTRRLEQGYHHLGLTLALHSRAESRGL